jgi:hypothetical protein
MAFVVFTVLNQNELVPITIVASRQQSADNRRLGAKLIGKS